MGQKSGQTECHELLLKIADLVPVAYHKFRLSHDGTMSMPYSTASITDIYGVTPEMLKDDFSLAWRLIHPDDVKSIMAGIEHSKQTMQDFHGKWRINHPTKGLIKVNCKSRPDAEADGSIVWHGYFYDVTELERAENERASHLRFFQSMDLVNRAIQGSDSLDKMMCAVLDVMLDIFDSDRAWLLYPCDPSAETMRVPMERTRPDYPGGFAEGVDYPITSDAAESMRLALASDEPLTYGLGSELVDLPEIAVAFRVQSQIYTALYPKVGKPWAFGMHQCSRPRIWSDDDKKIFCEIGRRLSDGLTSLLVSSSLRESEERFRQAFEFAGIGMGMVALDGQWLKVNTTLCAMLGFSESDLQHRRVQANVHSDDFEKDEQNIANLISGDIAFFQSEKRLLNRKEQYFWVRVTTSIVRDGSGSPLYFVAQFEDIDQHKRDEQQITLLTFSLNRVTEAAYLINENAGFNYVNDGVSRMLGYTHDELKQKSLLDIDPNSSLENWAQIWRQLTVDGAINYETTHKAKTGEIIPVEFSGNYFQYEGRAYTLALARDITERKRTEEALKRSEADLLLALEAGQLGEWKWDIVNDKISWSTRCKAIYGLPPDAEITYALFLSMVHPEDQGKVDNQLKQALSLGKDYEIDKRIIRPDGNIRYTFSRGRTFFDDKGKPILMIGVTLDITERKLADQALIAAEQALRESDERFRQMAENIQEVFWLVDVQKGEILYVSPAYESIWGQLPAQLYQDPGIWLQAVHPSDKRIFADVDRHWQVGGDHDLEYRILRPDGSIRHIHDRAFPIRDEHGNIFRIAGIAQDITIRKRQEEHIHFLAYHDALTGLPNRELVMNRLGHAISHTIRHKHVLAVLFMDLDRFKAINDTLGHQTGDKLLQQVGNRLKSLLREEDTIGRVGGDEFLIFLPGLSNPQDAALVSGKIISTIAQPYQVDGHELHINASVGISLCPRDAKDAGTLVKYADSALYLAKEQGRDTYRYFSPALDIKVRSRLEIENQLRHALDRNEFELHYQPQISLNHGKVFGAEALLRWQHPSQGLLSPTKFIAIAEESGLIIRIGEWVLRQVCLQAARWKRQGAVDFVVSANLSRRQLEARDFPERVAAILAETGCDPSSLELEITESSAMKEPEAALVKLQALHKMGIRLAIDDFGTGYSNLAHLKRFPWDRLKIDQSFVSGIPDDNDDVAIVKATIMLARLLRMDVIAEGVETEAQKAFLMENDCDDMQGFLFAKPMTAKEIESYCGFNPGGIDFDDAYNSESNQ